MRHAPSVGTHQELCSGGDDRRLLGASPGCSPVSRQRDVWQTPCLVHLTGVGNRAVRQARLVGDGDDAPRPSGRNPPACGCTPYRGCCSFVTGIGSEGYSWMG